MCARLLLAAVLLTGLLAPVSSAPVPPPPRLSAELLVGTWRYDYEGPWAGRECWGGYISFQPDGTYCACSSQDGEPLYIGTWSVSGSRVTLREQMFRPELGTLSDPKPYTITFAMGRYPALIGRTGEPQGKRVVLSDPRR